MDIAEIRSIVLATLKTIAPEMEASELKGDHPLRSQVDLDSMDWLNVIVNLHERLNVDIPEADYGRLATLDDAVAYLTEKLEERGATQEIPRGILKLPPCVTGQRDGIASYPPDLISRSPPIRRNGGDDTPRHSSGQGGRGGFRSAPV